MSIREAALSVSTLVGGVLFIAGAFTGEQAKPWDNGVEEVAREVNLAPAEVSRCREGWKDTSTTADHTPVYRCERNGWTVILNPDNTFNYGFQDPKVNPNREVNPANVPGWSK